MNKNKFWGGVVVAFILSLLYVPPALAGGEATLATDGASRALCENQYREVWVCVGDEVCYGRSADGWFQGWVDLDVTACLAIQGNVTRTIDETPGQAWEAADALAYQRSTRASCEDSCVTYTIGREFHDEDSKCSVSRWVMTCVPEFIYPRTITLPPPQDK